MEIWVTIVEDQPEIRKWLEQVITSDDQMFMAGVFEDAESCMLRFDKKTPDVVIMDIQLPGMNGINCLRQLKPRFPDIQFMMFTVFEDDDKVFESLCSGATGYILKNTTPEKLKSAIIDLYQGGSPMSPAIARKVISSFRQPGHHRFEYDKLTSREKELLDLLAKGHRYKEIANTLFISVETVRTHIRNIYEKLQVQSRTEALNKVFPRGDQS
ncbi:MAG: response regulator transcription factor [Bacteroidales bacterium]|nr:response regulator transcription factor [Bacteroidales bacterium]